MLNESIEHLRCDRCEADRSAVCETFFRMRVNTTPSKSPETLPVKKERLNRMVGGWVMIGSEILKKRG